MKTLVSFFFFALILTTTEAQNLLPTISNKQIQFNPVNHQITLQFDLSDPDNDQLEVICHVYSGDASTKYTTVTPDALFGDVGYPINRGTNKSIQITLNPNTSFQSLKIVLAVLDRETLDIQEIINRVDSNRLRQHVLQLQGRRNTGNPSFYDQSRSYLLHALDTFVSAKELTFNAGQYNGKNFEATKSGYETPSNLMIVDAHYDSFSNAPGADDNASGVAGVLEAIRILGDYVSKKSIRYVLFDLEEAGLVGSSYYVANQLNPRDTILGVVNFEMIGFYSEQANSQDLPTGFNILFPEAYNQVIANNRKGDFITNVGNTISYSLRSKFHQVANTYVPELKVISLDVLGNGTIAPDLTRSDHFSFWNRNIPALMITDGANFRNKNYHTLKDSVQFLNFNFMRQVTKASLATLIELAQTQHGSSAEFDINIATANHDNRNHKTSVFVHNRQIFIQSEASLGEATIGIYNINGLQLFQNTYQLTKNQVTPITNRALTPGLYFITLHSKNETWSDKLTIHGE